MALEFTGGHLDATGERMTIPLSERTNLTRAPRVRCVVRKTYIVDWSWEAPIHWGEEGDGRSGDTEECRHVKTYLSRNPAYLHAAWGWIKNAKAVRGCTKEKCAFGEFGYHPYKGEVDTRCKYCNHDKAYEIAKRLARWLRWRDVRMEELLVKI